MSEFPFSNSTVKDIVRFAFDGDEDISMYCDPNDKLKTIEELVGVICDKILDYYFFGDCVFKPLVVEDSLVGYYFTCGDLLVSFGVNKEFRKSEFLREVFKEISGSFKGEFYSYMWERNTRAIEWLKKCGMEEVECQIKGAKKLKLSICH